MHKLLLIWILLPCFYALAATDMTAIDRSEWLEQFRGQARAKLCHKGGYFRTCFDVPDAHCAREFQTAYLRCLEGEKIPQVLDAAVDGQVAGFKLGLCIGVRLEKAWNERKSNDSRCYARNKRW